MGQHACLWTLFTESTIAQEEGVRDGPEDGKGKRRKGKKGKKRKSTADTELFYDLLARALFSCPLCAFPSGSCPSFLTGVTCPVTRPELKRDGRFSFYYFWPMMLWFILITRRPKVLIHLLFAIKLQCRCIQQGRGLKGLGLRKAF